MIDTFGHHLIPLLSLPGAAGALGGNAHMTSVREACKSAVSIHGALTMVGRFEVAVVPDAPDFFDPSPGMTKARNLAWETIRTTPRLQWVIPTRNPEFIIRSLPQTWIGKGYQNVCLGLVADGDGGFLEKLQALRKAPVQHRMILLAPSSPPIDLGGQLDGIDWVVFSGNPGDGSLAAVVEATCREARVAFLFHQPDGGMESGATNGNPGDEPPWPDHPFGTKVQLSQPTLPELKPLSATMLSRSAAPAQAETKPDASFPIVMKSTNPPIAPALETLSYHTGQTTETPNLEVVTQDTASVLPTASDADHDDFERLDHIVRQGLDTFIEVGQALMEIRERGLWRAGGHATWAAYCQAVGGFTKIHANRLIKASELASHLSKVKPTGFTGPAVTPRSEWQIRPLYRLKDIGQQESAWYRAVELADGQPTEAMVSVAVVEKAGEKTRTAKSKPNRKQLLVDTFSRLRTAVLTTKRSPKDIEGLISELERLLKLT
jgi:hypothetical protein